MVEVSSLRIALGAPGVGRTANGVGTAVIAQANQLFEAGHDVTVIGCDARDAQGLPHPRKNGGGALSVELFPMTSPWNRRLHRAPTLRPWLEAHIQEFDVVDIHGVWSLFAIDVAAACRRHAVPYLLTPHGQTTEWDWGRHPMKKGLFFSLMMRNLWRSAAAIRFVSQDEATHSMVSANGNGIVIPNFVSAPRRDGLGIALSRLKRKFDIPDGAGVVLFLGRIDLQKGVLELIDAFNLVWQRRRDLVLMIVGPMEDAAYGKEVTEKAASVASSPAIRLTGPLFGEEKEAAFAAASLFATISKGEGMPIAVLEAMARAVPVLLTRESNLPQVVQYEAGRIANCTAQDIAESLLDMISDHDRLSRMGSNAQRLVAENFTAEAIMPQLVSLYDRVARRPGQQSTTATARGL